MACWKAAQEVASKPVHRPGPRSQTMSMLQIERVSKIYKSGTFGGGLKLALQQVSFEHRPG